MRMNDTLSTSYIELGLNVVKNRIGIITSLQKNFNKLFILI